MGDGGFIRVMRRAELSQPRLPRSLQRHVVLKSMCGPRIIHNGARVQDQCTRSRQPSKKSVVSWQIWTVCRHSCRTTVGAPLCVCHVPWQSIGECGQHELGCPDVRIGRPPVNDLLFAQRNAPLRLAKATQRPCGGWCRTVITLKLHRRPTNNSVRSSSSDMRYSATMAFACQHRSQGIGTGTTDEHVVASRARVLDVSAYIRDGTARRPHLCVTRQRLERGHFVWYTERRHKEAAGAESNDSSPDDNRFDTDSHVKGHLHAFQ